MAYEDFQFFNLIHNIYFRLADRRPTTSDLFVESIKEYLIPEKHEGMNELQLSLRSVQVNTEADKKDYDLLLHLGFDDIRAFNRFRASRNYNEWVDLYGSLVIDRREYNSYEMMSVVKTIPPKSITEEKSE